MKNQTMDETAHEAGEKLAGFVGRLALYAVIVALNGVNIMLGWSWFVVPLGVAEIGFAHGLGIYVMIAFLRGAGLNPKKDERTALDRIKSSTLRAATVLVAMWIIHLCQ